MPIIETKSCQCAQCGHIWIPGVWRRSEDMPLPLYCASCKSAKWNGNSVQAIAEAQPTREEVIEHAPIERRTVAKRQPKIVKHAPGKKDRCPHNFLLLPDGTTACERCKTGE
jgi:hypothetical protein